MCITCSRTKAWRGWSMIHRSRQLTNMGLSQARPNYVMHKHAVTSVTLRAHKWEKWVHQYLHGKRATTPRSINPPRGIFWHLWWSHSWQAIFTHCTMPFLSSVMRQKKTQEMSLHFLHLSTLMSLKGNGRVFRYRSSWRGDSTCHPV